MRETLEKIALSKINTHKSHLHPVLLDFHQTNIEYGENWVYVQCWVNGGQACAYDNGSERSSVFYILLPNQYTTEIVRDFSKYDRTNAYILGDYTVICEEIGYMCNGVLSSINPYIEYWSAFPKEVVRRMESRISDAIEEAEEIKEYYENKIRKLTNDDTYQYPSA